MHSRRGCARRGGQPKKGQAPPHAHPTGAPLLHPWHGATTHAAQEEGEAGPNSELQWWQSRLSKLSSITMQLKTFEAKATLGIASAARSRTAKRWHELEVKVRPWPALSTVQASSEESLEGQDLALADR